MLSTDEFGDNLSENIQEENMMKKSMLKILMTIFMSIALTSCVGTIQDANPISTIAASAKDKTVSDYTGIYAATAISNTRAEIVFPAAEGDADQIAYVIRHDGQQIPSYVYGSALRPDYRGLLKYTIQGLQSDTPYSFSVQARNIKTNIESANNISKSIKTFSNVTAIFNGVSIVRNLSGSDGLNGIEVVWPEAETRGGVVSKDEVDPIEYQITVIDANYLNPGDMNNTAYGEPKRKIYSVQAGNRSATVNGLKSGTKYYVQVRTVHYGYSLSSNSSNINYKKEENTNYLEISTYSENLSNLNFDNTSLQTYFPSGIAGLYSILLGWIPPQGNFDHYRIYYSADSASSLSGFINTSSLDESCSGEESSDQQVSCQYVDSNVNSFLLTGLKTNTLYSLALGVCLTRACESGKRLFSNVRPHTTTPPVASFRGITSIDTAKDLTKLDRLFLNFEAPDLTSGNLSGLIVEYYGVDINNPSPMSLNDSDILNTSLLDVLAFDYRRDTTIEISGIDPSVSTPYCFLIVPFTYNNDGTKTMHRSGLLPQCKIPEIKGPSVIEFAGIDNSTCNFSSKSITVNWSKPTEGIYNSYELFNIASASSFNFGEAFDWENNDYKRILIDSSKTTYTLSNLQPGLSYRLGLVSFYDSINGPIRSEINTHTIECSL